MALITCPHCGKSVSDSVDICIHCGGSLHERPAVEREFAALPAEEQKNLKEEFEKAYPEYKDSDKKMKPMTKKVNILVIFGVIFLVTGLVLCPVFFIVFPGSWKGIVTLCVFVAAEVIVTIPARYYSSVEWKYKMKKSKQLQAWLKREKNVNYTVLLDEKDRKKFEQITLD